VRDAYRDAANWTRMSILNTAGVGRSSSDQFMRDYCREIWHLAVAPGDAE
jgi:glycogen phosphorylase